MSAEMQLSIGLKLAMTALSVWLLWPQRRRRR